MANKKEQQKSYLFKINISVKKKREMERCAKAKGITINRFIKDAINQSIIESLIQNAENNFPLHNQLGLFDTDTCVKNGTQLDIEL